MITGSKRAGGVRDQQNRQQGYLGTEDPHDRSQGREETLPGC